MEYDIGITLSGGGARGIAHIGVLQALEEEGIFPKIISGCSAGALVGALYAAGFTPKKIFSFVENKSMYSIVKMNLTGRGLMEIAYFREILKKHIPHDTFEGLGKPFYISVTNLNKGGCEIIHSGNLLADYVIASSSIPLVFKPVKIGDYWYVDGGVINNLPVEPIRDKCKFLIGVDVNPIHYVDSFSGMMAIGQRILNLSLYVNVEPRKKYCDAVIETDTMHYGPFSINKASELYATGYASAKDKIKEIKNKMKEVL